MDEQLRSFYLTLWWSTLCVNLTGPQGAQILVNIILDVSVRRFLDEINISVGRLSKADRAPLCGWT